MWEDEEADGAHGANTCHPQLQSAATSPKVEALDEDEGRARKISAKWRLKQQHDQLCRQLEDGYWPKSAGTEMHLGFNAFDFSSSPEAFNDEVKEPVEEIGPSCEPEPEQGEVLKEQPEVLNDNTSTSDEDNRMTEVAKQVTAMGFTVNLQRGSPFQQLPNFGYNFTWGAPMHYTTNGDQRRAPYYRPLFYM
ncbi:unnamed protein product [Phytophthora fragariaefolia]|uniref:Unnamed protein product n=1 Tax=Phytophthora fragariaefolia TaxID=1490495 RepID=A0A9W6XXD6_9STRA|nr:unnamed protein product [Phytophthora fragariaefolia]